MNKQEYQKIESSKALFTINNSIKGEIKTSNSSDGNLSIFEIDQFHFKNTHYFPDYSIWTFQNPEKNNSPITIGEKTYNNTHYLSYQKYNDSIPSLKTTFSKEYGIIQIQNLTTNQTYNLVNPVKLH